MLTTKYVRDNIEEIKASLKRRRSDYPIDKLLSLDAEWRDQKTKLQKLQTERNRASIEIARLKKAGESAEQNMERLPELKKEILEIESLLPSYEREINELLWNMPNVLHESVPYGESEDQNVEIKKWGVANKKISVNHEDLLVSKDLLDIERASKVAGARFYYLKGDLVLLEQSIIRFAIDYLTKKGYKALTTPFMLRKSFYRGVTALADFEDMLYMVTDPKELSKRKDYERTEDDLFLIGTAEHTMAAMHAGEVFSAKDLPVKYVAVTPCFRREAGAHGRDTKGLFRVHQFYKVEQFIFSTREESWKYFDELIQNEEEMLQKLKLPYHAIEFCTGGIGTVAARKIDLEVWFPSQQRYREMTSGSNCTEWQSVRLDIKYDDKIGRHYVHTLNATALATTRAIVAIVENYLNDDGSISVPDVLVPYMGKRFIGSA